MRNKLRKSVLKDENDVLMSDKDFFDDFYKNNVKQSSKKFFHNGFCK